MTFKVDPGEKFQEVILKGSYINLPFLLGVIKESNSKPHLTKKHFVYLMNIVYLKIIWKWFKSVTTSIAKISLITI